MNLPKLIPQETIEKSFELTDSLSKLDGLIEKIDVLSSDMCENYIEKINLKTERGRLTAEIDFNIVKVMMDILLDCISEASKISGKLPELSNNIYESLAERDKC